MPVIQISRIQHRRGLSTEMPSALAEGELGLTLDTGDVVIGSPNFAPIIERDTYPYQNIRLLTEFSLQGLLETNLTYRYRYQDNTDSGYPGPTSYRSNSRYVVERLLQEKIDDIVSVKDYGAIGDGITNDTDAIRRAIFDVYRHNIGRFRLLYFPAGTYKITGPIYLMPNSFLVGDGINKTIIDYNINLDYKSHFINNTIMLDASRSENLPNVENINQFDVFTINVPGNFEKGSDDLYFPDELQEGTQIYYTGETFKWRIINSEPKGILNATSFSNLPNTDDLTPGDVFIISKSGTFGDNEYFNSPLTVGTKIFYTGVYDKEWRILNITPIDFLSPVRFENLPMEDVTEGSVYTIIGSGTFGGYFNKELNDGDQIFYTGIPGEEWKIVTFVHNTMVETVNSEGDTLEQINDFVGNDLDEHSLPKNICVEGITFRRNSIGDVVRLNRASDVTFEHCRFESIWRVGEHDFQTTVDQNNQGAYLPNSRRYNHARDGICVRIDSLSNLNEEILGRSNYTFNCCEFYGNTYGFYVTDSINNVTITNSSFEQMFKGVTLGEGIVIGSSSLEYNKIEDRWYDRGLGDLSVPSLYDNGKINERTGLIYNYGEEFDEYGNHTSFERFGPKNFKVMFSKFKDISDTPFSVYTNNPGNVSAYNTYQNYGYMGNSDRNPKLFESRLEYGWKTLLTLPGTINTFELGTGIMFYGDTRKGLLTHENASVGDIFDYKGRFTDLRVRNGSNFNSIMNSQDDYHFPYGLSMGEVNYLPMNPQTVRLPIGTQNHYTGIILDMMSPQKANTAVVEYSITRGQSTRKGEIHIVSDGLDMEWWESTSDIGGDVQVTFWVTNTASGKFRVKYRDERYSTTPPGYDPNDIESVSLYEEILLRWTAHYWKNDEDKSGIFWPKVENEVDISGNSGTDDWGLLPMIPGDTTRDPDPVTVNLDWGYTQTDEFGNPDPITEEESYGTLL